MSIFISTFWGFQPSTSFWLLSELSVYKDIEVVANELSAKKALDSDRAVLLSEVPEPLNGKKETKLASSQNSQ